MQNFLNLDRKSTKKFNQISNKEISLTVGICHIVSNLTRPTYRIFRDNEQSCWPICLSNDTQ